MNRIFPLGLGIGAITPGAHGEVMDKYSSLNFSDAIPIALVLAIIISSINYRMLFRLSLALFVAVWSISIVRIMSVAGLLNIDFLHSEVQREYLNEARQLRPDILRSIIFHNSIVLLIGALCVASLIWFSRRALLNSPHGSPENLE